MKCNHQATYFEDGNERCTSCGASRRKGHAKWSEDRQRHPSSLRPRKEEK